MAPRRGLLRRIADRLFGRGTAEPTPPTPPQPPIQPPSEGDGGLFGPPPQEDHEDRMAEIFNDVTGGGYNYQEWRELYDPLGQIFRYHGDRDADDAEVENYWDEFLRAYYLTTADSGHVPRERFHSDTGIPQSEVDWDLWREIKIT